MTRTKIDEAYGILEVSKRIVTDRPNMRALLIDLSGTLHIGDLETPGAVEALHRARGAGLAIRFCSNTSKESTSDLKKRLTSIGFEVNEDELWTSLGALRDVLRVRQSRRPYLILSASAASELAEYDSSLDTHYTEYDNVVIGLAPNLFDYAHLTKAFRILNRQIDMQQIQQQQSQQTESITSPSKSPLITTHRARYFRTPDEELSLGPGPFVAALENAVGQGLQAESVGKPGRTFFERVLRSLGDKFSPIKDENKDGANAEEISRWDGVALIGDDIEADLGGEAAEVGLWRVLVKTGKYQQGDENRPGLRPPDEVQESFAAFIDNLLPRL